MERTEVLIVGAGPTGLVLALWLTRAGVQVRIIDKVAQPGTTSRALAVQARTLELYRQLDLANCIIARGHTVPAANLWVRGKPAIRLPFTAVGGDLTPYSFLEIFPQDEHERLLITRLEQLGIIVERQVELIGLEEDDDGITAHMVGSDGQAQSCKAAYLAGCDGGHSVVRKALGIGFPGGTYQQLFYVADVQARGPAINGELHADLDEADFLAVFPLAGDGRVRLIGTVRDERADNPEALTFEDVSRRAIDHLKVQVDKVNWFSTYRVHHRVAEHFRQGRAFLLGDAAHVHSPAGGQGMNTGIGDAINLAWKLAAVLAGKAQDILLDSYEAERIGFARQLVATTDRVFSFATAEGRIATLLRTRLTPLLLPRLASIEAVREFMFRTVAQLTLNYRIMPLSSGIAGHVHGGDRLPWVTVDGQDNYPSPSAIAWQIHVYGVANQALISWCLARGVALRVFDWAPAHETAGFKRDALYVLRPDSYVALAEEYGDPTVLDGYFAERGLTPG
jgi:2-polyprenyl-6-methoxyphenol hydroxylase-like FAD-dependent oxidoreductase